LVDLTLPGVGRDPVWLQRVAASSGLHIVMGGGWYRTAYYPVEAQIDRRATDVLAEELVGEATAGVGDTGIRTGILGEIGAPTSVDVTPAGAVHRAVARASRRTGLAISTHAVMSDGRAQLTVFEEEGVDPGRVVIGHADSYPDPNNYLSLIAWGASIEFDFRHVLPADRRSVNGEVA
jgi:phosphotriesterase-related protein